MIILNASTDALEIVTSTAGNIEYSISYADHSSSGVTISNSLGKIASAATTTVVSPPSSGVTRQIRGVMISNTSKSVDNTVTIQIDASGSNKKVMRAIVELGESLQYTDGSGWKSLSKTGRIKKISFDTTPLSYSAPIWKFGVATEAAGVYHSHHAATGIPGAWSPGNPGLSGRSTYGTESADNGSLYIRTPSGGSSSYLQSFMISTSRANTTYLFDYVWVNTGISVTTTTAQTINSVKFPPRDNNGSSDGVGYEVGILVTTANTNVSQITNTTLNYTNSNGVSGRVATIRAHPITATAGTITPFRLQGGDTGIMSIQSITLGSSYSAGAISLIVYRNLSFAGCAIINIPSSNFVDKSANKLWPGTCAILVQAPSVNNAATIHGIATLTEK